MLKSMVCRCYTHHGCEFMLRFCTELSKAPTTTYVFFKSLDGTTSLYNKETGQLMVTFRNENRVSIT
jgi:glucose dehydrogenase